MATDISTLLAEGAARLARIADDPRREAEILLAAALDRTRGYVLAHPDESVLDCDATDRYEAGVVRRAHGEPIAYILGEKEFWSLTLAVTPAVLVPRPETELVVERALAHVDAAAPARILDLGTGSGAIALAIARERPRAKVVATDVSHDALEVARDNALRLHLGNVEFRAGSWYAPVAAERFTLIAGNPPYIATGDARVERQVHGYEPHTALYAGTDGLDALRAVIGAAPGHLVAGGWLVVEHGDRQGNAVRDLFAQAGFAGIATHRDLAGLDRCTEGRGP
jgi:release factor glutamine methyltransferase